MADHLTGVVCTIAKVPGEDGIIAWADSGRRSSTRTQAGGAVIAGGQAADTLDHADYRRGQDNADRICSGDSGGIITWSKVGMANYLACPYRAVAKIPGIAQVCAG